MLPVCIKVVNDIITASKDLKKIEDIEGALQKVCAKKTDAAEKKLVRGAGFWIECTVGGWPYPPPLTRPRPKTRAAVWLDTAHNCHGVEVYCVCVRVCRVGVPRVDSATTSSPFSGRCRGQ